MFSVALVKQHLEFYKCSKNQRERGWGAGWWKDKGGTWSGQTRWETRSTEDIIHP